MSYTVGIDLGGTNMVVGLVDEGYRISAKKSMPTRSPRGAEEICDDLAALYRDLLRDAGVSPEEILWVGIGSPGIVNMELGMIEYANNLQFNDVPLAAMLERRVDKKVYLENDGNAAAYGEFLAGAGRGHHSLVALTLGTGVGGGIVIQDKIYSGFNNAGGEVGHMIVTADGEPCTCGKNGCLEAYCSATALVRDTKRSMQANPGSTMWEICNGDLSRAGGKTAFDAKRAGDPAGTAVVDEFLRYLSIGCSNIINLLQPEILCIGGGISREGEYLLAPMREQVARQTFVKKEERRTKFVTAQLGNDAGIIGAAYLGKSAEV